MIWQTIIEHFPFLIDGAIRAFVIFLAQLGMVYILGRMLELLKTDRARNGVAILTAFPTSYWLVQLYDLEEIIHPQEVYWRTIIFALVACIFFVLIGWKLFDRVDNFFDTRFAPDEKDSTQRRRKKK